MIATAVLCRPDEDDAFYANLAVSASERPLDPILATDTMHRPPGRPIQLPVYKLHSFEMLGALAARSTGIPAISFFHHVVPPVAAACILVVYALLFRETEPRHWVWGVLAVVLVLFSNGGARASYGNLSFVRLHQGKALLFALGVPCLIYAVLRFWRAPALRSWVFLAATAVSCLGCSSTAVWLAPLTAATACAACLIAGPRDLRRTLGVLSAAAYPAALGLGVLASFGIPSQVRGLSAAPENMFRDSVRYVFRTWGCLGAYGVFLLTGWLLCRRPVPRSLLIVFPAVLLGIFANPWLDAFWGSHLTGVETYWRIWMLLPLPFLSGLSALSILQARRRGAGPGAVHWAGYAFLLLGFAVLARPGIWTRENGTRLDPLSLKVPPLYSTAERIRDLLPDRPNVLCSKDVSPWIPTLQRHPYPILARMHYGSLFGPEGAHRETLVRYVSGDARLEGSPALLQEALTAYRIRLVEVPRYNPWLPEIAQVLEKGRFVLREVHNGRELWTAPPDGSE
jgi:hypothetical protein